MADPVDEYAVHQLKESDGTKPKPTTKEGLVFGDHDEKKTLGELNTESELLRILMKKVLGNTAEEAVVNDRVVDSLRVLTMSKHGWSAGLQRSTQQRDSSQAVASNNCKQHNKRERKKERKGEGERGRSEQEEKGQEGRESLRKGQRGRGQEGRKKEEEREAEEGGGEQVEKDVTGWTELTRKNRRKTVQIFVKMNGSKATPMEVNLTNDKVEDVLRQVQNDEDVYVTMHGRMLKRSERLRSYGVTDGCTIQVTSRMRGGGRHKGQKERKRAAKQKGPEQKSEEEPKRDKGPMIQDCDRDTVVQIIEESEEDRKVMVWMLEENEDNRKMIVSLCEGSDVEVEQALQNYQTAGREVLGWDQGQADLMERGLRWAVGARRKERREEQKHRRQEEQKEQRREEQEQRRQEEQEQIPEQEQGKKVRFGEEEPLEETRAESTDEPEVTGRLVEVRTGRGSTGLVRGRDERHWADESSRKTQREG